MKRKYIEVDGLKVRLDKRKSYKNIRLKVMPPYGEVAVSAPEYVSDKLIRTFIRKNISEIRKTTEVQKELYKDGFVSYENGSNIKIFGKDYKLEINETSKKLSYIKDDRLIVQVKDPYDKMAVKKEVETFQRKILKDKAQILFNKYQDLMGLEISGFTIRKMKSKRGSCNIDKKHINLNLDLARYETSCLEYIIVHELSHLKEKGHDKNFYRLVSRYYPSYKEVEGFLDQQIIYY